MLTGFVKELSLGASPQESRLTQLKGTPVTTKGSPDSTKVHLKTPLGSPGPTKGSPDMPEGSPSLPTGSMGITVGTLGSMKGSPCLERSSLPQNGREVTLSQPHWGGSPSSRQGATPSRDRGPPPGMFVDLQEQLHSLKAKLQVLPRR